MRQRNLIIFSLFLCFNLILPALAEGQHKAEGQGKFIEQSEFKQDSSGVTVNTSKGSGTDFEKVDLTEVKFNAGENVRLKGAFTIKNQRGFSSSIGNYQDTLTIPTSEIQLKGNLTSRVNFNADLQLDSLVNEDNTGKVLSEAYVSANIIPHHTISLGKTRLSSGHQETPSLVFMDAVEKNLKSNNLSSYSDLGLKVGGNWNFVDYCIGAYNGNGLEIESDNGIAAGGWAVIKPLYNLPEYGSLEIGGGYYASPDNAISQSIYSVYSGYKYKRLALQGEYTKKEDNAASGIGDSSWYVSNTYYVTDKLSLIAKHNQISSTQEYANDLIVEYSLDENRLLKINNLKVRFNASYVKNNIKEDTQRIGVQAGYSF